MSLEENAGRQEAEPQADSLLPFDFKDSSAQKRKPLPLGQFMKKAEQKPIMEPVSTEPAATVPRPVESAPEMAPAKAPIQLTPRPAAEAPAPTEIPVPEAAAPQPRQLTPVAAQPGSAAKPIPLTARPKPLTPVSSSANGGAPRQLKPVSGPRTFSEKEHAEMKQQANKAAEKQKKPSKPATKPAQSTSRLQESSLGGMLQAARTRAGLSVVQVESMTRIKKSYLESLEADDIDNLPPRVFISAYVRNLSALYNISAEDMEIVNEKRKELGSKNEVPEALIQNLEKDGQVNMAEEMRVRKMLIVLACAVILVVLWISGVYLGLKIKHTRDLASAETIVETGALPQQPAQTVQQPAQQTATAMSNQQNLQPLASSPGFNSTSLERFIFQENPTMTELRIPGQQTEQPAAKRH